ncbi:hypothetical protein TRIUR3_20239 [Triticum urartu]|uniref:Uncharacterized protein n=1 Tax=Triticum urartu TaxID=4572 RepID=M8A345_TRIUA|nr:hypothetical protein TRIUR3_20239 [Triticum urartu]
MAVLSYCMMDEAVEESSIVLAGLIIPLHGDGIYAKTDDRIEFVDEVWLIA